MITLTKNKKQTTKNTYLATTEYNRDLKELRPEIDKIKWDTPHTNMSRRKWSSGPPVEFFQTY